MRKLLILAVLIASAGAAVAVARDVYKLVRVDEVTTWIDHPVFIGAKTITLVGDPTKAETVVQRLKLPPNYRIPPHTHPHAEVVTVLSGAFGNELGEKFDPKGAVLRPGSVFVLPAQHAHYSWTGDEETTVQFEFTGPAGIDIIKPADDPRWK